MSKAIMQTTIAKPVHCSGIGLHGGRKVNLCLRPAQEDTGIIFSVKTRDGVVFLSPRADSVISTALATTIGFGNVRISTVEHILAAVRGLEIDNIMIEVDAVEVPIMDGSAASFVFLFNEAGIREQNRPRKVYALKKSILFEKDGKKIKAAPSDGFSVDYKIEFAHPMVGRQTMFYAAAPRNFVKQISKARTFGFIRDVEKLQSMGLALGGSLDNAVVLDEYGVINTDGLRYPDEFVRHKILDFIGDMGIAELPMLANFEVEYSGHAFNNEFLRYITANRDDYLEIVTLDGGAPSGQRKKEKVVRHVEVPAWA